jgi:hypothetical protein
MFAGLWILFQLYLMIWIIVYIYQIGFSLSLRSDSFRQTYYWGWVWKIRHQYQMHRAYLIAMFILMAYYLVRILIHLRWG